MKHMILTALLLGTAATAQPANRAAAFDAQISSADQMAWLKTMASGSNHLGSDPRDPLGPPLPGAATAGLQ